MAMQKLLTLLSKEGRDEDAKFAAFWSFEESNLFILFLISRLDG